MPRPQYTQEELTQLANQYQMQAYPYIDQLVAQLYELEQDETRPQGSPAYLARKAHLNSQIYLMTQYAMDARQNIEQGYPPKFHADSIRNLSNRLMEDPVYAQAMMEHTYVPADNQLLERETLHAFREEMDAAVPASFRSLPSAERISRRYNRARHLRPGLDDHREDYVDITRDTYKVTPERTLQDEYDAALNTMRQITDARLANGQFTQEQRRAYSDAFVRAVALQSFMLRDPAGAPQA